MTEPGFVETLRRERASAIVRAAEQATASGAMDAAVRGGFRIVEFTLTTPGALELIAEFSRRPGLVTGAGTVLTRQQARDAVRAGARYLVSPVVDPEVIAEGLSLGVAVMPGCQTPTEMLQAHRVGAQVQKVFPAPAGGPGAIRAILGPMPFLRLVPTNGVDAENAAAYLAAGAWAVAFTAALFLPEDLRPGRFDRIEARARRLRQIVEGVDLPA
ncbi:MAG: bifunctional 4-hydroxy-2-oxoglutarate aldolase/2-dehydro-3-deoxy-phosphogluconate aldolase [Acidobacteria bacterium]|nr:bifunctional 4-hydroxy-2-oxoglutarate aldolase/2-dehydro-3-deoxy-phosphogluconate aldolase [Acidobacteriota bacterium]